MAHASRGDGRRMGWSQEQIPTETQGSAGHVALQKNVSDPESQSLLTPKLSACSVLSRRISGSSLVSHSVFPAHTQ